METETKKNSKHVFKGFRLLKNPFALLFYIVIIIYTLSLLIPCAWMIISSLRPSGQFTDAPFGIPKTINLNNYLLVFQKLRTPIDPLKGRGSWVYMPQLMLNGVLYAALCTAASLCMQILVSYGVAKYDSIVGNILYGFAIVTMILPLVGTMPARLLLYKNLNIYDNFIGIVIASAGWGGSNFLILHATFKGVPEEYREAAFMDGATHFRVLLTIMIPMIRTTILALFILGFIGAWNDYQTPMVYMPNMPTIAYGLFQYVHSSDSDVSGIPMQITGCVVVMVPIMILFIIFRNQIMGNLAMGGIKG